MGCAKIKKKKIRRQKVNVTQLVVCIYSAFLRKGLYIFSLDLHINSTSNKYNVRCTLKLRRVLCVNLADSMWMSIVARIHLSYLAWLYTRANQSVVHGGSWPPAKRRPCVRLHRVLLYQHFQLSYAFSFLPVWFHNEITHVKISESHMQITDLCEPGLVASPADSHVFQGLQFQMLGSCRKSPGIKLNFISRINSYSTVNISHPCHNNRSV